ncbi:MAG: prepilin-type N-terminal cleavage/methylation domain-containing protein [Parcubacteria group bacterium]|jgi:prepilin-type N-terminal cleavage/methylation domain-containing protein
MKNKTKNKNGFSLIEMLIATFIFSVIMVGVAGAFSRSVFGYRSGKTVQKDLEQGEYGMNLMAKTIRTSSVIIPASSSSVQTIVVYDYSQSKCIAYQFDAGNHRINTASTAMASKSTCIGLVSAGTLSNMISNVNNANFSVVPSQSGVVGKITISIEVTSGNDIARLQTTVSLRDYSVSGI